jgi:hypothetical protein
MQRRMQTTRCVWDVLDRRLHHHGCEQATALRQTGANGVCTVPGCATNAKKEGGRCFKHGGVVRSVYVHLGCITKANARGLCVKHGGHTRSVCVYPGCTTKATARGLCTKHGGDPRAVCVCIWAAPPNHKHEDSARSTVVPLSNDAKHPIVPPPQRHTDSAGSTVHLGCDQNQSAPPKCKSEDGVPSTATCSIPNDFG